MAWTCYTCYVTIRGHKSAHCAYCHKTFTDAQCVGVRHCAMYGVMEAFGRYNCRTCV